MTDSTRKFEVGDRVQATLFFIKSRQHRHSDARLVKTVGTCGIFDGYKGKHTQVSIGYVRWLTDYPFPHEVRQQIQLKYIEPYGSPR